jgi:DNA-binding transcriptional regulator YdaS (Cro superfamily)
MKRGEAKKRENPVAEAVSAVGGPTKAARICGVSNTAVHKWIRRGSVALLKHALPLSRASGVPIDRFIEDESEG